MKLHGERWALDRNRCVCISGWAGQYDTNRKKGRPVLAQSSQQREKQIGFCDCCWETAPKDPHTENQYSQGCSSRHYTLVSSMNAAEMTGVKQSDLITCSAGRSKLLCHISILTPQSSSGWTNQGQTRPVRPRMMDSYLFENVLIVALKTRILETSFVFRLELVYSQHSLKHYLHNRLNHFQEACKLDRRGENCSSYNYSSTINISVTAPLRCLIWFGSCCNNSQFLYS